jgi:hypothetical protein
VGFDQLLANLSMAELTRLLSILQSPDRRELPRPPESDPAGDLLSWLAAHPSQCFEED